MASAEVPRAEQPELLPQQPTLLLYRLVKVTISVGTPGLTPASMIPQQTAGQGLLGSGLIACAAEGHYCIHLTRNTRAKAAGSARQTLCHTYHHQRIACHRIDSWRRQRQWHLLESSKCPRIATGIARSNASIKLCSCLLTQNISDDLVWHCFKTKVEPSGIITYS